MRKVIPTQQHFNGLPVRDRRRAPSQDSQKGRSARAQRRCTLRGTLRVWAMRERRWRVF